MAAELRRHAEIEGVAPPPDLVREVRNMQVPRWRLGLDNVGGGFVPRVTATENELARMVALPVLRETAVEVTKCPICIEDLGEVGKTVLKCGHTVCVSCFLQQMMRATTESRARDCACPVCRVNYIM
jgi:hypothetical protein